MSAPRVAIGLPVHNHAEHLAEALESLLSQTDGRLGIAAVDDGSTDDSSEILRTFASSDSRLVITRNPVSLGLVGSWRAAFRFARSSYPEASYFAWASDHDIWAPNWLTMLLSELEDASEAVLAYPLTRRVDVQGRALQTPWRFDTRGLTDPRERFKAAARAMVAGDMIYGLFRISALEKAGPFPRLMLPDRLLLAKLSVEGEFRQVDEILWQRRMFAPPTISRQRQTLFGASRPASAYLPWWLVHASALARELGDRPAALYYLRTNAWISATNRIKSGRGSIGTPFSRTG